METTERLGCGLEALLSVTAAGVPQTQARLDAIEHNPSQPRKRFDDDELAALTESVRSSGVLQPLVVRQVDGRLQLVAGERRLRAARNAGLASVPVHIIALNDEQVVQASLAENIQRSDLNPIEKAQGFKDYLERFGKTHEQLAACLGLARPTVTGLVALLKLPPEVQDMVRVGQLSAGHAKVLNGLADREKRSAHEQDLRDQQVQVAKEIVARGLSVHATEAHLKPAAVSSAAAGAATVGAAFRGAASGVLRKTSHVKGIEHELRQKFAVRVEIKMKAKSRGHIALAYESNADFERIVEALRR